MLPYATNSFVIALALAIPFVIHAPTAGATFTWNIDADGDWEQRTNWTPFGFPDRPNDEAVFGTAITAGRNVTVTSVAGVDVQRIVFDNPHTYIVDGGGRAAGVNLSAADGLATIDVRQGAHEFAAIVNFLNTVALNVASDATLEFSNSVGFVSNQATTTGEGEYLFNSNPTLVGAGGLLIGAAGTISGHGTIGADLQNVSATVAPGTDTAGLLTVAGNYTQGVNGRLRIHVGGSAPNEYDQLRVIGQAALAGRLEVTYTNGFVPSIGQSLTILPDVKNVGGSFDSMSFTNPPGQLAVDIVSGAGVQVQFVEPDLSNGFSGLAPESLWADPKNWTAGAVPDSTNAISVQNSIGGVQRIDIPKSQNAFVHELTILGQGTNTLTVGIQGGGNLSATSQLTVGDLGIVELTGGTLASSTVRVEKGGLLSGGGRIFGNVVIGAGGTGGEATLSPGILGGTFAKLQIEGDYQQASDGNLVIDIYGSGAGQFDSIDVLGQANLGGTLTVNVPDVNSLTPGTRIMAFASDGFNGKFEQVEIHAPEDHYGLPMFDPDGDHFLICLSLDGDMDCQNGVSNLDLQLFALALFDPEAFSDQFGYEGHEVGDMDNNGYLDFDDIALFAATLPTPMSTAEAMAAIREYGSYVPEPAAAVMLVWGIVLSSAVGRSRSVNGRNQT